MRAKETRRPSSDRDLPAAAALTRAAILEQLDRIVRSPAFSKSQRYPAFLRYCVEAALDGRARSLKERTIGVDVFERPVGYEPATDHVVRSAACEVRKRLAQYYQDSSAAGEIRVELHPGSYVPRFAIAEAREAYSEARGIRTEVQELQPEGRRHPAEDRELQSEGGGLGVAAGASGWGKQVPRRAVLGVIPASVVILASIVFARRRSQGAFNSFWRPIIASEGQVIVCVGAGLPSPGSGNPPIGRAAGTGQFSFASTMSLLRLSGMLEKRGARYRVVPSSSVTFGELQGAPSILIGAYNNPWSLRYLESLRFQFGRPDQAPAVYDRKDPQRPEWAPVKNTRDYAVITRVRDKGTGQTVVILGGIEQPGTSAATGFLTDPAQLQKLQAVAPDGWQDMNLQVVLSTDLVNGVASHPQIVATHFW